MTHLFTRDYHKAGAWPLKTNRYSLSHSVVLVVVGEETAHAPAWGQAGRLKLFL